MNAFEFDDEPLRRALNEDLDDRGDITSIATCNPNQVACAKILAKENGIIAGLTIASRVFRIVDDTIRFSAQIAEGSTVVRGEMVTLLEGNIQHLLTAERVALNYLARLSGIATLTARYVQAVTGTNARILDTRKTTPGLRELEKYAVRIGGGENHRSGLFDMFLIKENHISAAGSLKAAVKRCRELMRVKGFESKIEVEVQSINQVKQAVEVGVDRIMLDNMKIAEMRHAVEFVGGQAELEASGNVDLENVRVIAETGVDFISVGRLTHSVNALDLSLILLD